MTVTDSRAEWWTHAACSASDPELFFPIASSGRARSQLTQAKAICARCEVQQACLDYALDARALHGIWGGMTEEECRRLRRRKRRARIHQLHERAAGADRMGRPSCGALDRWRAVHG
jgi:WhiB family redox-sensing transcriptional regulator